jgi:hypothetical protein
MSSFVLKQAQDRLRLSAAEISRRTNSLSAPFRLHLAALLFHKKADAGNFSALQSVRLTGLHPAPYWAAVLIGDEPSPFTAPAPVAGDPAPIVTDALPLADVAPLADGNNHNGEEAALMGEAQARFLADAEHCRVLAAERDAAEQLLHETNEAWIAAMTTMRAPVALTCTG